MAQGKSDGTVYVDTKIDTSGIGKGIETVKNKIGSVTNSVKKFGDYFKKSFTEAPTGNAGRAYEEVARDIKKAEAQLDKLIEKQIRFVEIGGNRKSQTFAGMEYDIEMARNRLFELQEELSKTSKKAPKSMNVLKKGVDNTTKSIKKMGNTAKKSNYSLLKMLGTSLLFSMVFRAISTVTQGFVDGLNNLVQYSDEANGTMSSLKSSLTQLKNSFATAFMPIITFVAPALNKLISMIVQVNNLIAQFFSALSGKSTYTKAVAVQEDYAESLDKTADSAKKAQKYLSGLDEIRTFTSADNDKTEEISPKDMFEEVEIDSNVINFIEKIKDGINSLIPKVKELAEIFKSGFMDGLGDFQPRLDSIKESIASIKESLIDIFTDPAVKESANGYLESFVYMLGQITGSIASMGLTIAANLVGGLARYLEENKDRIKDHLVTMFDIGTEINVMIGNFASAIAYIFEAFAGENGQQLTANIIGIFANAFMGIVELAGKFGRDVINIITKPFIEQKEKFRTAFDGILGVFAEVTGTLKQGIDDTFAKLNEVYDQHFKPFFDSLAQGISDLTGQFLDFWNNSVQPILDEWAAKFDVLWKEHIQPFLNNVGELLGSVADLLKVLWETVLKPVISWIVENVLPILLPILQALYDTFIQVFGAIFDTLSGLIAVITEVINFIVAVINGDWSAAWEAAKNIVIGVFETVHSFIEATLESLIGIINVALETILGAFELTLKGLYDQVVSAWDNVTEYTSTFITWIKDNISSALDDVKEVWNTIWDSFSTKISDVWTSITDTISGAIEKIKGWVSEIMDSFSQVKSKASSLFSSGFSSIKIPSFGTSKYNVNVPKLATGSVIPPNAPFMAMLGDQKHGTNIEAPLDTIKQAVREVVGSGNGGVLHAHLYLDGKEVLTSIIDMAKLEQTATGINPLLLT